MNGSIKSKRIRVFVYGSLMWGFHNHHLLNDRVFVREAKTEARFELYSLGAFPAWSRTAKPPFTARLMRSTPRRSAGSRDILTFMSENKSC